MADTFSSIASGIVVTNNTTNTVTFGTIPTTFTDLCVLASVRTNTAAATDGMYIRLNGDSGSNYNVTHFGTVDGSTNSSARLNGPFSSAYVYDGWVVGGNATANTFNHMEIWIPQYNDSTSGVKKSVNYQVNRPSTATNGTGSGIAACTWTSTAAITSVSFTPTNGTYFVAGTCFYLYGITNS